MSARTGNRRHCTRCGRFRGDEVDLCRDCKAVVAAGSAHARDGVDEATVPDGWVRVGVILRYVGDLDADYGLEIDGVRGGLGGVIDHGSNTGYGQHRLWGVPQCADCRAAHSTYNSANYHKRKDEWD